MGVGDRPFRYAFRYEDLQEVTELFEVPLFLTDFAVSCWWNNNNIARMTLVLQQFVIQY